MKSLKLVVLGVAVVALSTISYAQSCMMYPVSLDKRVTESALVVEGKVVGKQSFWNAKGTSIYTANQIEVFKVFKGILEANIIVVVTDGGIVGTDMEVVNPSLQLSVGDVGVFTLQNSDLLMQNYTSDFGAAKTSKTTNPFEPKVYVGKQLYAPHSSAQGFVKYDQGVRKAAGVFDAYDDVYNDLYHNIQSITSRGYAEVKSFEPTSYLNPAAGARAVVVNTVTNITDGTGNTIAAGVYKVLRIAGSGFGTTVGQLLFPDADNGGATTITCPAGLIMSWTDTQIDVMVPSGATTGNITVKHAVTGSATKPIIVPYNVSNLSSSGKEYAADLINHNAAGGYTWTYNTTYYANKNAVKTFAKALCDWSSKTQINWDTAKTQSNITAMSSTDGVNICTFNNLSGGTLGVCHSYYSGCSSGGAMYWYVNGLDIEFNTGTAWNYNYTVNPTFSQYDLYSVALHELGHGHQQGHYALTTDIMYWSIANGAMNRTIDANATTGGAFIMTRNVANETAHAGSTGGSSVNNPCGKTGMIKSGCAVGPNCFDEILNQTETNIDCGGPCAACATFCTNGIQDHGETGVDCGGACAACCTPPANDSICGAVTMTLCSSGTLAAVNTCTKDDYTYDCVGGENMLWYKTNLATIGTGNYNGFDITITNPSTAATFEIMVLGHKCTSTSIYGVECGAVGTYSFTGLPTDSVYYIGVAVDDAYKGTFNICMTPTATACLGVSQPKDNICTAEVLALGACSGVDSNVCATADYQGGCVDAGNPSVWYAITMTGGNNKLQINYSSNTFLGGQVEMMLLDSICSAPQYVAALCGNATTDTFTFPNLTTGATYYLLVSTNQGNEGKFNVCATGIIDPCVGFSPANDSICKATAFNFTTPGTERCVNGTNQCSTPDYSGGCIDELASTVWYDLNLDAGYTDIKIHFDANTFAGDTVRVGILEGTSCDSLDAWVYRDCIKASADTITVKGLDAAKDYFVMVSTSYGDEGTFTMCVNETIDPCAAPGSVPSNDSICGARTVPVNGICLTGQTNECSNQTELYAGCMDAGTNVVWYRFKMSSATTNSVKITLSNYTLGNDVRMMLVSGNGAGNCDSLYTGVVTVCNAPSDTFSFENLDANLTYWLAVGTPPGQEGDFDICVLEGTIPPGTITGPEQDCPGGVAVCNTTYSQVESYIGPGASQEVFGNCLSSQETNSLWYIFTVQEDGKFGFTLNTTKDYDYAVYDISLNGCSGIIDGTSPLVRCNYCGDFGPTGLDTLVGNTTPDIPVEESAAPTCNRFIEGINVTAGETYALIVDNYSADNNGYVLTFNGASVYDTIPPQIWAAEPLCKQDGFVIYTNEPVLCASINIADFTLISTDDGLDYTSTLISVTGDGCSGLDGQTTNQLIFEHDGSLKSGNYRLCIKANPSLADKCLNKANAGCLDFEYVIARLTLTTSKSFICEQGEEVIITASGLPAGEIYMLNPGGDANSSGVFTVYPNTTTVYNISSDYAGCLIETSIGVVLINNITTTISPNNVTICSGTTDIIATTTLNGAPCQTCYHTWSLGGSDGQVGASDTLTAPAGTYTVIANVPQGCFGDPAEAIIRTATVGNSGVCEVMYVSPTGLGSNSGLIKSAPTTLDSALARAICTNTVIKCAVGDYVYNKYISVNGFVTIEGGFNSTFTTKTSSIGSTAGAFPAGTGTRFIRNNLTADNGSNTGFEYSMFRVVGGSQGFRFQDIKILMPGATETGSYAGHAAASQKSNYGIKMGTGCANYNIVRCVIDAGDGANE